MICIIVACALVAGHATACDVSKPAMAEYVQVENWTECRNVYLGVRSMLRDTDVRAMRFETQPKPRLDEVLRAVQEKAQ